MTDGGSQLMHDDDLLDLATTDVERDFAAQAVKFLSDAAPRRVAPDTAWGSGPEDLALFHETSDDDERREAALAKQWQRRRFDAGFGWITGPPQHGGAGLPPAFESLYRLIEAAFDIPDMNPLRVGLSTVGPALVKFGNDDQIARYGRAFQTGELVACQLFSEPDAGSDLASVRTRGIRDGNRWLITGQKVWTSNASFADVGLALVRTDSEAPKHRGLTMFLIPMTADGVDVRPLRQMTGGASFSEVFLSDVRIADDLRVGEEGSGWQVATGSVSGERRAVGDRFHETTARALALLRAMIEQSSGAADPVLTDRWVQLYGRLRVARFQQQRMQATPEEALSGAERAIDKLLLTANMRRLGELAADLLGPELVADVGKWGTFNWNRWVMGAMGYRIAGGTEEILKTMIAERMLGLPRDPR